MPITDLRSSNLAIPKTLREHIARRLDVAIRRFWCRVVRLVVRLDDVNGATAAMAARRGGGRRTKRERWIIVVPSAETRNYD